MRAFRRSYAALTFANSTLAHRGQVACVARLALRRQKESHYFQRIVCIF